MYFERPTGADPHPFVVSSSFLECRAWWPALERSPPPPVSSRSISSSAEMASFCCTEPLPLASASCACVGTASATFASAKFLRRNQHAHGTLMSVSRMERQTNRVK